MALNVGSVYSVEANRAARDSCERLGVCYNSSATHPNCVGRRPDAATSRAFYLWSDVLDYSPLRARGKQANEKAAGSQTDGPTSHHAVTGTPHSWSSPFSPPRRTKAQTKILSQEGIDLTNSYANMPMSSIYKRQHMWREGDLLTHIRSVARMSGQPLEAKRNGTADQTSRGG